MRRIITIAIIIAVAAITAAWSVSTSGSGSAHRSTVTFGGGSSVPTHTFVLW